MGRNTADGMYEVLGSGQVVSKSPGADPGASLFSWEALQHLCLDKVFNNKASEEVLQERYYAAHIRRIGEEKKVVEGRKHYLARRWVVERTLGWFSQCRAILVRYEKKASNYLGLIKVAVSFSGIVASTAYSFCDSLLNLPAEWGVSEEHRSYGSEYL